ncbi:MAG: T9SS type A sorting domain-containing protein [Bacteroidetes bacterium]|nr:T9SS type A sorting domain-containing protein [Bacteroidota bacterium]
MKKFALSIFVFLLFTFYLLAQPTSWSARGVGGGGALFSPSINPANTSEYYIACDMSELFHTTDFGLTYSQVHFSEFMGGQNAKVCFTSTTNLLYAISYVNDIGTPVTSTDNGVTWVLVSGNPDPSQDVYTIHVDYSTPSRIIISTYGEIYFSNNGGTSFTLIHTAINGGSGNIVGGVFFDGLNIYIGTNDGVLISTNGGGTWSTASITGIPAAEAIFSFTGAKVGATIRFFCTTGTAANMYVGLVGSDYSGFLAGVYSCDYGSTQWVSKMTGITPGTDEIMYVDMAENDINTAYLAGSRTSYPEIMKTVNAGGAWAQVFNTNNNQNIITGWSGYQGDKDWSWGECPFGFDVSATNKDEVIFGDFGFCHKTNDGGVTWKQAYVNTSNEHPAGAPTPKKTNYNSIGMENTTCWQVFFLAAANNMWASYSDIGGIRSTDGGNAWSFNYTGNSVNSTYRVAQGANGTLYAGTSGIHDMYQSTRLQDAQLDANDASGKIVYSTDNGLTWTQIHSFGHPVFWVALDPNNPNRAYASVIHYGGGTGLGGVYRCDNLNLLASSTWTLLPNPLNTEKHPACLVVLNDGKLVATYSGRRNSSGTFTASSGCFIYDPVANSWTDVTDPGMKYWTKDIVVDQNDVNQNTWYVGVFSGWGGNPNGLGGLYKTTNRGISWTKLTGSTLDRVTSCTFNPSNANEIYLTTETQGLWMSSNINSGTPTFSNVASYPFRQPERVFFNPTNANEIWVSSFGNGMKTGTLGGNGVAEFQNEDEVSVYPNPASTNVFVILSEAKNLQLFNTLGEKVGSQQLAVGKNSIDVSKLQNGIYFLKIGNSVKRIVVNK